MALHHRHVILTVACLAVCCATVSAQNMIGNDDFDTDVSGWVAYDIQLSWDPSDCQGATGSGSALLTNDWDGTMHAGVLTCVDGVVPGQSYDLGGMLRIPTGQMGIGSAYFGFYWYDAPGCTGTQTWADDTNWVTTSDVWVPLIKWGNVAPPGTQSAWIVIGSSKTSAGTDAYLSYHDAVYFGIFGWIFADGFESGTTDPWSSIRD